MSFRTTYPPAGAENCDYRAFNEVELAGSLLPRRHKLLGNLPARALESPFL